jgi:hypothetical protein
MGAIYRYRGPLPKSSKGPSKGLIIGVSIGAALLIGTLAILACFCVRRRREQQAEGPTTTTTTPAPGMQQDTNRPISVATTGTSAIPPNGVVNLPSVNMRQRNGYHVRNDSNFSSSPFIIPSQQQNPYNQPGPGQWPTNGNGNGHSPAPTHSRQTSTADQQSMHSRGMSWYEGAQPMGVSYNNADSGINTNSYFGGNSIVYPVTASQQATPLNRPMDMGGYSSDTNTNVNGQRPQQYQQTYVPPPPGHQTPRHVPRASYDNQDPFRG